ncbi:MAG: tetratricopeptide repeat protein [Rhodospirillales bacterium]|nr:tetratricopeptide repeat protein [Alphaproteobacteria bacterium]MCB9986264.1 tetratricopeptide repeat protein [Rhodospirillales bacterium]USO07183.1 MAG: tetratricopeptide repeat protein [Rhodospirillales bacterium]
MKRGFNTAEEAIEYLDFVGTQDDSAIDLFEAALALSSHNHPGLSVDKYRNHRKRLADDTQALHQEFLVRHDDDIDARIWALGECMTRRHGYIGDDYRYNDLQNADLIRVVDRRLGLPVALSLLCITVGDDLGWAIEGLSFPAHYVIRLEKDGRRAILDPFQGCIVLGAHELREILKSALGPQAELSASYYEPASRRDTLIRLENNIKLRQIEAEDYQSALATVELMKRIAPDEYRLDLDAGVLLSRLERPAGAIAALERYIDRVPNPADRRDAALLLQQLRGIVH